MTIDFDKIENIEADVIISLGEDCRVAKALQRNNLRYFSNPFDWMMKYSLINVVDVLSNKGKTFFINIEENPERKTLRSRCIIDKDTEMVSLHDFSSNLPIDKAQKIFHKTMKKRFKRLDLILKKAKTICLISSRMVDLNEIKLFIDGFKKLYTFDKLYFINTFNCDDREDVVKTEIYDNVAVYEYYFRDEHEDGSDPKLNPKFWMRNIAYWDKIMSHISLNNKFVRKYKDSKLFGISYVLKENCVQKIIHIFGIKIKFRIK